MNIDDYKKDKKELNTKISELIQNFEKKYDCHIYDIELYDVQVMGFESPKTLGAKVKSTL